MERGGFIVTEKQSVGSIPRCLLTGRVELTSWIQDRNLSWSYDAIADWPGVAGQRGWQRRGLDIGVS